MHFVSSLLPKSTVDQLVKEYLKEDVPSFDFGGAIVGAETKTAHLYMKQSGTVAGMLFFNHIFSLLNCTIETLFQDGAVVTIPKGEKVIIAKVYGPACNILLGERVALNTLTRASGIATQATYVSNLKREAGFMGVTAGTRKTTPGFRLIEKYALLIGGCDTHRMDLSSMVMLKDNHIWAMGSITKAVKEAKRISGFSVKIEVECRHYEEAKEAILAGADIVMLDNYAPETSGEDARRLKTEFPHVLLEVSGGITPATVSRYFSPHVDIISMGCLTQGYPAIDFSLKIVNNEYAYKSENQ